MRGREACTGGIKSEIGILQEQAAVACLMLTPLESSAPAPMPEIAHIINELRAHKRRNPSQTLEARRREEYRRYISSGDRDRAFLRYVNKTESCWLWTGGKLWGGYGRYRGQNAHRFAWKLYRGTIPKGLHVLHKCDVPGCVNPDHLYLGTQAENMHDKAGRGRTHVHARHLRPAELEEMRALYAQGGYSQKRIAEIYGVCIATANNLLCGRTVPHGYDRPIVPISQYAHFPGFPSAS